MLTALRKARLAALVMAAVSLAACNKDNPTENDTAEPPTNFQVSALGSTAVRITFTGRAGDASYNIERGKVAATVTFAQVATVNAPAAGGQVQYDDTNGLEANTAYQYRVSTIRGSQTSTPTGAVSVTTAIAGRFAADVTGDITANRRFAADTVYTLKGFIHVTNGATLTIDPGTVIKGDFNILASSLFILRGAKIIAVGTPDNPIVFTSSQPVGQRKPGDWGGLILVGNGIDNRSAGDVIVEGTGVDAGTTPGTNYSVVYTKGTSNDDSSGELRYVRVEFAGYAPRTNEELNSFTFAAVGKNTKVSYLEALAGLDDSYEFFGGAVDADHLVSYEAGDDHFDMSEGYVGRLQYLIAFQSTQLAQRTGAGSPSTDPQGIENDGCNGTFCTNAFNTQPFTIPIVANFTLVGTGSTASAGSAGGIGMMLRRGTGGYYVNGIVARWPRFGISLRDQDTFVRAGSAATPDLTTAELAVKNVIFVETPTVFEPNGTTVQNAFDLATNVLSQNTTATTSSLFVKFPASVTTTTTEADFDWMLSASSAAATGGLGTFIGKLATAATGASAAGNTIAGTAYLGAVAPNGTKWWVGWTKYAQQ